MQKKIEEIPVSDENCPVRKTLSLLGGKWTLLILFQINNRVIRYGALKRAIPGISEKVLIGELKVLIENNLVLKTTYQQIPPKVEYQLTEKGLKTLPIAEQLASYGLQNLLDN
jgi:DNA-binding HxlR family transcriptional regulator